jgi:hypothetical protein
MRQKVNTHFTNILSLLKTTDINIWTMCLLNEHGILLDNPLICPITKRNRDKKGMAKHMGCGIFARLVQWGICVYDLDDKQLLSHQRQRYIQNLNAKENTGHIPSCIKIQQLFENSILRLKEEHFELFRRILRNCWVLQPFRQPITAEEKPFLSSNIKEEPETQSKETAPSTKKNKYSVLSASSTWDKDNFGTKKRCISLQIHFIHSQTNTYFHARLFNL